MSDEEKPLQKITELEVDGSKYDLAANGKGHLVSKDKKDAYGNPMATVVNWMNWSEEDKELLVQSLLDYLVTAHRQLQTSRDSRLGVGKDTEK